MLVTTQWPPMRAAHPTSLSGVCVVWRSESVMELSALWFRYKWYFCTSGHSLIPSVILKMKQNITNLCWISDYITRMLYKNANLENDNLNSLQLCMEIPTIMWEIDPLKWWNNCHFDRQHICKYYENRNSFFIRYLFTNHDDVIKWKHFPRCWPFVRGIHWSQWIPRTKASDAELSCFLSSAPE